MPQRGFFKHLCAQETIYLSVAPPADNPTLIRLFELGFGTVGAFHVFYQGVSVQHSRLGRLRLGRLGLERLKAQMRRQVPALDRSALLSPPRCPPGLSGFLWAPSCSRVVGQRCLCTVFFLFGCLSELSRHGGCW